ncbi:MAG TPA: TlpA disulfide reductase family protein [Polaromonas sp.]|uniref:TlpA disulfide reductase family protein n=1 Tax=Polaromonas sp. TaxID=1869339 RepID=UPI002D6BF7AC|nr:TlpA disulfide reductase family protein [Polaromonas sp.]HYW58618.1 TlpA disulfide reductase family protein [Polaromonas sp.]
MKRRSLIYGGAAVGAGLAGAGLAWWRLQASEADVPSGAAGGSAQSDFWRLTFETPDGSPLALSRFASRPLLVNFWATWCPPCVEELPLIDAFYQEHKLKNWQVLGLAIDQPSAVRAWLQKKPLSFPVAMAGFQGTELSKSLGNLSGGLPFTVVFGASGQVLHRKSGKVSPDDLAQWARLV